jgi:hypothetical protein
VAVQNPSKVVSVHDKKNLSSKNEEEDEPSSSQQFPLSQTDETIRQLERDGKMEDVVGARSILSQEIYAYRKPEDEEEDGQFANIHSSQEERETHTSMAKRLGLLTQDDDDDGEKEEQAEERGQPQTPVPTAATRNESMLRDTPIRESECFGSLLEAVQKITEQEDLNGIYSLLEQQQQKQKQQRDSAGILEQLKGRTKTQSRKRKSSPNESKPKSKLAKRKKKVQEEQEAQERAKRAAVLAEQTVADPEMAKKLLLSMALVRENPRSSPETWPSRGSIVGEGFFWAHYPPLEIGKLFLLSFVYVLPSKDAVISRFRFLFFLPSQCSRRKWKSIMNYQQPNASRHNSKPLIIILLCWSRILPQSRAGNLTIAFPINP